MNQDPLTKLSNRRHLFEKFEVISKKYNNDKIDNVIAVITDIDRFKEVNDTFGHDVGDEVLIIFADLITSFTRNEDVRVRFGGDEFFILFVDTPIEVVLNRVNELIEAFSLVLPQLKHIFSASFGIVKMRKNDDLVNLIKMSDEALYQSKQNGKAKYTLFNRN
jgi:two-component system cell cycle response regulator